MKPKFGPGDKVFAKVRGYPPWPARVEGLADETPNRMRYHIYFYGTGETAVVKAEDICSFVDNRGRLGKPKKHKNFTDALLQIEAELSPEEVQASKEKMLAENENDDGGEEGNNASRRSSTSSKSGRVSGAKREKKRRMESENSGAEDVEHKKARTSSHEDGLKSSPEVLSRSGRKIKPKRFADFDDSPSEEVGPSKTAPKPVIHKVSKPSSKVDESEKLSEPMEEEEPQEDVITVEVDGTKVDIPLKMNRPHFKSSKSAYIWDSMVKNYAYTLKKNIENGEIMTESIDKHMDNWTKEKLTAYEIAQEERDVKLSQLRVETLLLDLDTRIKSSLSLNKAEPDKCLNLLDELLGLEVSALMLKKHPEIVETIKKMRKYVGNTAHWRMSSEEACEFHKQAAAIRKKSETVYSKFKNLFLIPNGKSFWETFAKELEAFNKKTENMTMEDVFSLVKEPE